MSSVKPTSRGKRRRTTL